MERLKNSVICGDCLNIMENMSANSMDLILTDPPYSASKNSFTIQDIGGGDYETIEEKWDLDFRPEVYFEEMFRVGEQLLIFSSHHQLEEWLTLAKNTNCFRQILHYVKTNPMPSARKLYKHSVQYIIWVAKSPYTFKRGGDTDIFNYSAGHSNVKHPSVKNLKVIEQLIVNHSEKDDIVLDPFLGSGTTAVASKKLGRKYIGVDISEKYCEIARQRLSQEYLF